MCESLLPRGVQQEASGGQQVVSRRRYGEAASYFPESVLRKCRMHRLSTLSELYSSSAPLPYHKTSNPEGQPSL